MHFINACKRSGSWYSSYERCNFQGFCSSSFSLINIAVSNILSYMSVLHSSNESTIPSLSLLVHSSSESFYDFV